MAVRGTLTVAVRGQQRLRRARHVEPGQSAPLGTIDTPASTAPFGQGMAVEGHPAPRKCPARSAQRQRHLGAGGMNKGQNVHEQDTTQRNGKEKL